MTAQMNALDGIPIQYGLLAIFLVLMTKSIGVLIPMPNDLENDGAAAHAGVELLL